MLLGEEAMKKLAASRVAVFGVGGVGGYVVEALARSGKKLPPIYLSCGTADGLYADNVAYRAHLEKLGYTVTWDEDGSGHEWGFWNRQVGKFIEEMVK